MMSESVAGGQWMKLNDAAHALGMSEITLRRKVKTGKIRFEFREGKYFVFVGEADGRGTSEIRPPLPSTSLGYEQQAKRIVEERAMAASQQLPSGLLDHVKQAIPSVSLASQALAPATPHVAQAASRNDFMQLYFEQQLGELADSLKLKDLEVAELKRQVEDQQTLIAFLESALLRLNAV